MQLSERLSIEQARAIALAAQGFGQKRPRTKVTDDHIRQVIHRLGLVQIDYANVVLPAHYFVLFSRLGAYDRSRLDHLIFRSREFIEHWAHEASIVPVGHWPLLRYRRESYRVRPYNFDLNPHREYSAWVLEEITNRGAMTPDRLPTPPGAERRVNSWFSNVTRVILETHFGHGLLAIENRLPNFARSYDLVERVIAVEHRERTMPVEEAHRELLAIAAQACGIATAADLADYFRMPVTQARPRLRELVEANRLKEVTVEGWRETAFLHPSAQPKKINASALLAPFDPLVWYRPRLLRLFDFDYRFEIFVPPEKRRWGCYVLPFLLGDRLVARVDLKADRENRKLLAITAYLEPHADAAIVAPALAKELKLLARWLDLDGVEAGRRGEFSRALRSALRYDETA